MTVKTIFRTLVFTTFTLLFIPVQGISSDDFDTLFKMPLDELLKVKITTATRIPENVQTIPASVVIITRKEIEKYGYTSLRDIVNNITGYYVMSNLGIDIYGVRGFTKGKGNNFVVLINGVKISDEKILTFYQGPVEAIDRIEVVRGPLSVIYGNNAFFGAINIITDEFNSDKSNDLVSSSYGSMNTSEVFTRFVSSENKLKVSVNASYSRTDGMDEPLSKMISRPGRMDDPLFGGPDNMGLALPGYARQTGDYLDKNQKFLNVSATMKKFYFNSIYNESVNDWYYYYPSLEEGCIFKNHSTTMLLGYKDSLPGNIRYDLNIRYASLRTYHIYNHLFEGFYGWDRFIRNELEGQLNFFYNPNQDFNLTFGIQYENMLEYKNFTDVPIANLENFSLYYVDDGDQGVVYSTYFQIDYNPFNRLKLVGGIRIEQAQPYGIRLLNYQGTTPQPGSMNVELYDKKGMSDIYTVTRFASIYSINDHNFIKLLYGEAIKRAAFDVIAEDMNDIALGEKPSGYSKPEYITTREVTFTSSSGKKFGFDLSLYRNTLDQLIVENNAVVNGVLRAWNSNSGEIETKGLELTFFHKPLNSLYIEISGVYQKTRNKTFDIDASYSPDFLGYLKIVHSIIPGYSIAATGNYVGKMKPFFNPTPTPDNINVLTGRTSQDVDAYLNLDLNLRAEPKVFKGGYLDMHVANVLDSEYFYPTFSINNAWADKGTLGMGRTFLFTVGYKF